MNKAYDFLILIKEPIEKAPPIISIAVMLARNDFTVKLICGSINNDLDLYFQEHNIEIVNLNVKYNKKYGTIFSKVVFWSKFRIKANRFINKNDYKYLYLATADTAISLYKLINKKSYFLHLRELYDTNKIYLFILKQISKNSIGIIVPEINRAYLYLKYLDLPKLPIIIPNRSVDHPQTKKMSISFLPSDVQTKIKSKRNIIFQGIISKQRDISNFIKVLDKFENFNLILLGENFGMLESYKKISSNIIHIDFISPPLHLNVTSWADIGIICYDFSDLNHIFCAPNKLYEYSGFSIPILCSENPGIKYPVEGNNIGISTNFNQANEILSALNALIAEYNIFEANSKSFYKNSNYDISEKLKLNE